MAQTLVDLSMKVDTTDLTKAQAELKKTADATKAVDTEQSKLIDELKKATNAWAAYEKQTSKVESALKDVGQSFNPAKIAAAGLATAISALSLNALKDMVFGVINVRKEMYDLSIQTGISVSVLSGLKGVAMGTSTSMDDIAAMTTKFNQAVTATARPTTVQSEAFGNLGIKLKDNNGHFKDTITLQQEAAQKLNEHANGIEKDAYYMTIWGKSALQNREYLIKLGEAGEIHGKMTDEQAKKSKELDEQFIKLQKSANGLKAAFADELIPTLSDVTVKINEVIKAAGGLGPALHIKNIDLFWTDVKNYGEELKKTKDELDNLKGGWGDRGSNLWMPVRPEALAIERAGLEARKKTLEGLIAAELKLGEAERVTEAASLDHGKLNGKPKTTLTGLKRGKEGTSKNPTESGYEAANKREEDSLITLRAEYLKLFGVQADTNSQKLEASIAAGEYAEKTNKVTGEVTRLGLSQKQLNDLRAKAKDADYLTTIVEEGKAQKKLWEEVEKSAKAEDDKIAGLRKSSNETRIAREVMRTFGATQDDVNIAVSDFNISQAETAIVIAKMTNASEQEVTTLQNKLNALKEIKVIQQDDKQANDDELIRQHTFSNGWKTSFDAYKKNAADAAGVSSQLFQTASKGMEDAIVKFATTGKLSFSDFATSVIGDLVRIQARKMAVSILSYIGLADGGVLDQGGMKKFAKGDVFSQPTNFTYGNGQLGQLGEAGPEAVMPLKRGANGALGVAVQGGGGGMQQNITIQVTVQGGQDAAQTGDIVSKKILEAMKGVANQAILTAQRNAALR